MQQTTEFEISLKGLNQLSQFAVYLLDRKIDEYVACQVRFFLELNPPLLQHYLHLSEKELIDLSLPGSRNLLSHLAENKPLQYIEEAIQNWQQNNLSGIKKGDIAAEDITLINYGRKKALQYFIPGYTSDAEKIMTLVNEIDQFIFCAETRLTHTYISILKQVNEEDAYLVQKVNETIPGAIYVFDIPEFKGIYSNKKLPEIIGYDQSELNNIGTQVLSDLIHPDDKELQGKENKKLLEGDDKSIHSYKYRVKDKNGNYQWLRNYESVFKRNEEGKVIQKIGITLNINTEEKIAQELKQSEAKLLEAQEIARIGSFSWNLETNTISAYPITYEILGIKEHEFKGLHKIVHPGDRQRVFTELQQAMISGYFDSEFRVDSPIEKYVWSRCRFQYKDQKPFTLTGTIQDITEKKQIIHKLQRTESLYKQAEILSNMGNWNLDIKTNKLEWTDQLYRIYGLEPRSEEITVEKFISFIHPEDRPEVERGIELLKEENFVDSSFRIIDRQGKIKVIRSIAQVHRDNEGRPVMIVGTERDTTEKQTLIDKLRESENLYKQAQAQAHLGNWSWDIKTNKITWSEELYRIFGLSHEAAPINFETYISLIHPEDRERVQAFIDRASENGEAWELNHRVITNNGEIHYVFATGEVIKNRENKPVMMLGTVQNVTEQQILVNKLRESDALYKQAQFMAKIGNFSWDLSTNRVFWSDEIYTIYEMEKGSVLSFEEVFDTIKEKDKAAVQQAISNTITKKSGHSISYGIQLKDLKTKYINLETDVILDTDGNVQKIIGTAQDITEKQLMIEQLKESERLYKQAQSIAQLGNWSIDFKTGSIKWSDEIYRIYETSPDQKLTTEQWYNYVHPDDLQEIKEYFELCIKEKRNLEKIHRIIIPGSNKIKTIHRIGEIILDEEGNVQGMVGTTQDVTEQFRIQQALNENQNFIRKITDSIPSIITSYNIHTGKYVFVSQGLKKLLGYEPDEAHLQGIDFLKNLVHPDDLSKLNKEIQDSVSASDIVPEKNDIIMEFTYRIKHKNGHYRWMHTYGTVFDRNTSGNIEHLLNITLDVTDQIEASQKISDQEHFIQQIADASPTILYLFDVPTQSIIYINREIFFMLGYSPEEIIQKKSNFTKDIYHEEDQAILPERVESKHNFHETDTMMQYECRLINKNKEVRWFLVREIVFKKTNSGKVDQILGAALDITQRKELEKTIIQNTMKLEQSNASLEEFAYVASHDLKEPLRKISTFGDRLRVHQEAALNGQAKIYLEKIIDASQRMQTMINDLLSISMISGNKAYELTSLQSILTEVLQTLEFKIEQKNAKIVYDTLPEARIIPSQFRQLFQNLLSNSLKFVDNDLQPLISIKWKYLDRETAGNFQLSGAERYLKLDFTDNGIGFENEFAGKIFAIFQRLHGRSEYEGSGIGLSICKKIVEHHGGIIFANGIPGKGSTFSIIIPS